VLQFRSAHIRAVTAIYIHWYRNLDNFERFLASCFLYCSRLWDIKLHFCFNNWPMNFITQQLKACGVAKCYHSIVQNQIDVRIRVVGRALRTLRTGGLGQKGSPNLIEDLLLRHIDAPELNSQSTYFTHFPFRHPYLFTTSKKLIFPRLIASCYPGQPLRNALWIASPSVSALASWHLCKRCWIHVDCNHFSKV